MDTHERPRDNGPRDDGPRRIRIGDATGDVIDVGYLDTTLWEFGGDVEFILADLNTIKTTHRLKDLLPHPFDARFID